jgi:prolipoprotein diacylglyceryltransferase
MAFVAHPELHPVFEALGYLGGYAVYKRARQRSGDFLSDERRWLILAATALGALAGSRILGLLEQAPRIGFNWHTLLLPGGKTIVGGLLGGWLAVEIAKLALKIHSRTGDLFAIPLCVGIAIGRIGCFVAGLADDTYGTPTRLPWGVDFGDGIRRHPTQLYEIVFLLVLAAFLYLLSSRRPLSSSRRPLLSSRSLLLSSRSAAKGSASLAPWLPNGALFRIFMAAYLTWRLLIDFIKPQPVVHGLNMIQWACIAGLLAVVIGIFTDRPQPGLAHAAVTE